MFVKEVEEIFRVRTSSESSRTVKNASSSGFFDTAIAGALDMRIGTFWASKSTPEVSGRNKSAGSTEFAIWSSKISLKPLA